jgi:hypothetical protein
MKDNHPPEPVLIEDVRINYSSKGGQAYNQVPFQG